MAWASPPVYSIQGAKLDKLGFEKAAVLEGFVMDKDGQESDIVLMIKSLALAGSEFHHT